MWAIDLKPLPDNLWAFAVAHAKGPAWIYEMRMIDPTTNTEVFPPKTLPLSDTALDGHETVIYRGEDRIFLYYRPRATNLASYLDAEIASFNVSTGKRTGFWTSNGKFGADMKGDYLHINSVSLIDNERVLASARSTSSLYVINLLSGLIEDTINSTTWDIEDNGYHGFSRQHFAHVTSFGTLMMYDNRDASDKLDWSRAVEYQIDWKGKRLKKIWEKRSDELMKFRFGWGSATRRPDGSRLVSWGDYSRRADGCAGRSGADTQVFTHFDQHDVPMVTLSAPCGWATYRVYAIAKMSP
jgi:hypothetical protein